MRTPYYVINQDELDSSYNKLKNAFHKYWNNYIIGYSYKTNSLPWIIKHMNTLGAYAEVVSDDEYELAKLIGVKPNNIIYNGPIKSKESFEEALNNGCYVNIDSQREIEWLSNVKNKDALLGIRVNFDIEAICPNQSQCLDEGGRFGFCYENGELEKAIKKINELGFNVNGLHLHTSSKTRSIDIYRAISSTACMISKQYNLNLKYVDIGGGFFGGLTNKPQFDEYIYNITEILKQTFYSKTTTLIVEPGMSLIGSPVSYFTTVIDIKDTSYGRFVITDGSRTSIDPLMTKTSYFNEYKYNKENRKIKKQIICGYTCMEHDRLFILNNDRELCVGDVIIYNKVGAYTMCLTPLFIKYFPDVYVSKENNLLKVRNAWTPKEYVRQSIID